MSPTPAGIADAYLTRVVLDSDPTPHLSPVIEADRARAVAELADGSEFTPLTVKHDHPVKGPFALRLSVLDGRLVFDIRRDDDTPLAAVGLALGPFRRLIKDYQLLVDSHLKAVEEGRAEHIQAVDMGRRGLHNEGAALMRERLAGKIAIDFETARRLFTLVCVLHQRV